MALHYTEGQVKQLLRRLPYLLSVITSPKNSAKTAGTPEAKVYEIHHSTFLLDLIADLTLIWNQMPPLFQRILYEYFILGETDLRIEAKTDIAAKSVHRIRQMAVNALTLALTTGDMEALDKLREYKRYNTRSRKNRIQTRVWKAK